MSATDNSAKNRALEALGIKNATIHWNLPPEKLEEIAIAKGMATRASNGAICVSTGKFTGRAPKDRFIVKDEITRDTVWWGNINMPFEPAKFDLLQQELSAYLSGKEIYARDAYACADPRYRLNIRFVTELPWSNEFVYNMFLRPTEEELAGFTPEWTVLNAPGFEAVKKGIFSALNFILPHDKNVLSMHCSANLGEDNDTALFFGLSGTGKTTLSADPERKLIGDDEHGWSEDSVFNFEGGCYAKCINLSEEKEPDIYHAIKPGATK